MGREKRSSLTHQLLRILLHEGPGIGGAAAFRRELAAYRQGRRAGEARPAFSFRASGTGTRRLTAANARPTAEHAPLWRPADKVYGNYLTPYLHGIDPAGQADAPRAGV